MITWIGADVAKASVVLFVDGRLETLVNEFAVLKRWLGKQAGTCCLVVEGSGGICRAVVDAALGCQMTVYAVNPADFASYRDSLSYRTKTDPIDAELLARFGEKECDRLRAYKPASAQTEQARALLGLRDQLVSARSAIAMSFSSVPRATQEAAPGIAQELVSLSDRICEIERTLRDHVESRPVAKKLLGCPGFGLLVTTAIDWILDKGQYTNSDQLVAMVGLDVRVRQSGKHQGLRKLTKRGDQLTRQLICEAANSLRRNKAWKSVFAHYEAKGLSSTAVNAIVARKLLRIAFAVVTGENDYDPAKVGGLDKKHLEPKKIRRVQVRPRLPRCVAKIESVIRAKENMAKTIRSHLT